MIRYRFYIGLMAAALLPVSCSQQEDIPALQEGETVSRISLSRSADGGTASTIDGRYKTLTVYAYKGTDVDNSVEFKYENKTVGWKQDGILKVPVPANDARFIGMTGTESVTQSPFRFEFSENAKSQDRYDGRYAADFMTTDRTTLGEDNSLSLDFKHRMVQVTVKITDYGTELGEEIPELDNVSFKSAPAIVLNYNSETGEATVTSISDSDLDITPAKTQDEGCYSYTAIIAPKAENVEGNQLMSLKANGKTFMVKTNTALESGKHYTFNLKVGKDLVKLESVSITPWGATKYETGITTNVALPEATGDGVGVFVHYGDNDPDNADNLKLSANNMIEHVWKSMDVKPHIVIYSPYNKNLTYNGSISLEHGKGENICYASINADRAKTVSGLLQNGSLNVTDYRHIMGKLTLKFKSGNSGITPSSVELHNYYATGSLSVQTGIINYPSVRSYGLTLNDWNSIVVLPQIFLGNAEMVTAVFNGNLYTYFPDKDITVGEGEHLTITLTIPSTTAQSVQARSAGAAPQRMEGTITVEKN